MPQFFDLIHETKSNMLLCAPFIKKEIVDIILSCKDNNATIKVITSANIANFMNGSLDIEAIKTLISAGVKVYNFQNLHAKIYLFDNKKALITSANLTSNAMYKNFEYGLLLNENEYRIIEEICNDVSFMMKSELCGFFTSESIAEIERLVKIYSKTSLTKVDINGDNIIILVKENELSRQLKGWKKDVFDCINSFKSQDFALHDIYKYEKILKLKHPSNNRVHDKIRQTLQYLRDLGFVKFVEPGKYKKLWVSY